MTHRNKRWLFPADGRNHTLAKKGVSVAKTPMSEAAVQGAMKLITTKIDFGKKSQSPHVAAFLCHPLTRSWRELEIHPTGSRS
ncbi:hypothetical protein LF1_51950 [Rubripirellula obstinata]|uniref:Uncharacterized protein n=1 Tax=Rubripirellula obstinata TaxID=406547 RepID=A0A5B1C9Z7_9BACT|nr:hypothetical protein LF1_51950 [Rubripirellula obstinata]